MPGDTDKLFYLMKPEKSKVSGAQASDDSCDQLALALSILSDPGPAHGERW